MRSHEPLGQGVLEDQAREIFCRGERLITEEAVTVECPESLETLRNSLWHRGIKVGAGNHSLLEYGSILRSHGALQDKPPRGGAQRATVGRRELIERLDYHGFPRPNVMRSSARTHLERKWRHRDGKLSLSRPYPRRREGEVIPEPPR